MNCGLEWYYQNTFYYKQLPREYVACTQRHDICNSCLKYINKKIMQRLFES